MKLAQITDLHARFHLPGSAVQNKRESRAVFDLLPAALEAVAAWEPDLLAVTGDLLDVPLCHLYPSDYYPDPVEAWRPLIEADYLELKRLLDASGLRYTVLPGNHDHEPSMWRVFDPEPRCFDVAGHRVYRFHDREWHRNVPRRIDRERLLFGEAMDDTSGLPQIHLQHYPVAPAIDSWYPYNYAEADELRRRTAASGKVALSLAGHYHDGCELLRDGEAGFAVGPVFGQAPFRVARYEIADGGVAIEWPALSEQPLSYGKPAVVLGRELLLTDPAGARPGSAEIVPGAGWAIAELVRAGRAVIAMGNCPAVGGGYLTWKDQQTVHEEMGWRLAGEAGDPRAQPEHVYADTSSERPVSEEAANRSEALPSPAMLEKALARHGYDRAATVVVAEDPDLLTAGAAAGLRCWPARAGQDGFGDLATR